MTQQPFSGEWAEAGRALMPEMVALRRAIGGFLRTRAQEKWPVQEGHFRMPGWIWNGDRKQAGVFVVHVVD